MNDLGTISSHVTMTTSADFACSMSVKVRPFYANRSVLTYILGMHDGYIWIEGGKKHDLCRPRR